MRLRPAAQLQTDDTALPAASTEEALHGMFRRADVVFSGTVTKIETAEGATLVRFRVEDGIRGIVTSAEYTLREWSGLWSDDPNRYVVGERRLMLLHAASPTGFSSPVAGMRGSIRLRGDAAQAVADLRWVATDVAPATTSVRALTAGVSDVEPVSADSVDATMLSGMLHAWQRGTAVVQ